MRAAIARIRGFFTISFSSDRCPAYISTHYESTYKGQVPSISLPFWNVCHYIVLRNRGDTLQLNQTLRSKAPIGEKNGATEGSTRRVSIHSARSNSRHSDKYQRILDAAILVIAEHGYFQSRVSEIADRAGVAD